MKQIGQNISSILGAVVLLCLALLIYLNRLDARALENGPSADGGAATDYVDTSGFWHRNRSAIAKLDRVQKNPLSNGVGAASGVAASTVVVATSSAHNAASSGNPTGVPNSQLLGVFCGNDPRAVMQFETWLGRRVDAVLGYTGGSGWADYDGSVAWASGLWRKLDRRVLWSVPLIPKGASLSEAAQGKYDDHYRKAARTLAMFRPEEAVLYIRTGWEFNGDWFPWSAHGKAKEFMGAFQKFVTVFRDVSPRFRFEWNMAIGDVGMDPESAYPGDAFVDIIGMDFYWNTKWDPPDAEQAYNSMLTRKWGLKWHQEFAAAHHKPTAYSEWGVMSNDSTAYIQQVMSWFASHDVVYQTYWNSDADFRGELSSGQYPAAGDAYRAAFGRP